ncbi:14174_t:CDS:2 [Acaulospora morrowiae]|uniref:14174_t:CDS:1 n=1 Tax=Acaulospora morrowiae TaxID=94023 RepID=A0A9N9A1E2_9GLOM|nr:14174_t:CDS:2 [Acaulospora morrowiae]
MVRLALRPLFVIFIITISWISNVKANIESLNSIFDQQCSGMFAKSAIPGGSDPKIEVTYSKESPSDAAVIVYEWADNNNFGVDVDEGKKYICDDTAIKQNLCSESELGKFIVSKGQTSILTSTFKVAGKDQSISYPVNKTGYYCVAALSLLKGGDFLVVIDWRNPYGELPAADYPKLPFYGLLSLTYLAIGIVWMTLSIVHWRDILQVQNYISAVILFLMLEMAFNWGYWENYNTYGYSSKFLLGLVAVLNAGRNSISFFMLLIVCMGYGVVKPTLGSTMNKCRALAAAHFIFGIIYAAGTMLINPDTASPLIFLVIFPLAFTMTAFYVWTLQSITTTLQTLEIRRQNVKSLMYKRLYRLLVFSVSVLGIFFFINMFNYIHREDADWIPKYWQWRWFLLDGWLNILYLIVFSVILVIWRPTRNNKRYPFPSNDSFYSET